MDPRPLRESDVEAAARMVFAALGPPPGADADDRWIERRTLHLLERDPGGAWVAEQDGAIVGLACASVRDGIWGLSMLAVQPRLHARGIGTRLLDAALSYADGTRGGIILSSQDPKAMRLYARAGFRLHPAIALAGILDRRAIPAGLRARPTDDLEAAGALARPVRGGAYDPGDLALQLTRPGSQVLMIERRGFVLQVRGKPVLLAARDPEAATDLLWSALADTPPGGTIDIDSLVGGQDWAVQAGLAAGLAITPQGPVYTRGEAAPMGPWIPSGSML